MKKLTDNIKFFLISIFTMSLLIWFLCSILVPLNNVTFNWHVIPTIHNYSFFIGASLAILNHFIYKKTRKKTLDIINNFFNNKVKSKKIKVPKEPCSSCKKKKK